MLDAPPRNMRWLPGGPFTMGCDDAYPEERPAFRTEVGGFWMDVAPVTNAQFAAFVRATGYVTLAEQTPDLAHYPDADPALAVAGSLVFLPPTEAVPLTDYRRWWKYMPGACWKHPEGPDTDLRGREQHPVVHVAHADALAYAQWAGKALPTEAEWEYAARGGLDGAPYAWGYAFTPRGQHLANTWQGEFPWHNLAEDGYAGTSPVGAFPPNSYGLYDLIGNVWEWTADEFTARHQPGKGCCTPARAGSTRARMVVKGGSHLCAPNYCQRYRPSARQGETADSSTGHIGFRCVIRGDDP